MKPRFGLRPKWLIFYRFHIYILSDVIVTIMTDNVSYIVIVHCILRSQ